ncbi:MAG: XTP/dITP diphosphatase [Blastochloris sp.]|nr:XTP/dITP diphosphatase [Blastochloris sp.]
MKSLLIATRNLGKVREFREILGSDWQVLSASDLPHLPEVIEDGATFEENSVKKARECSAHFAGLVLADDSGLEVDALAGAPGVYSARFAGEPADDPKNNQLLLQKMEPVEEDRRGAQFVCVLSLARDSELLVSFQGKVRGRITRQPSGKAGFGYDPLFVPEGYQESFAELGGEIKHRISHRARAMEQMISYLKTNA